MGAGDRGHPRRKKKVDLGFVRRVQLCRQAGQWPFPNPPQTMTQAQMIFYDEALRQLEEALKEARPESSAPRRASREQVKEFIRAKGLRTDGD